MSNVTVPGTQKALDKCYYYHIHHHYPQAPAKVPEASLKQNARVEKYSTSTCSRETIVLILGFP